MFVANAVEWFSFFSEAISETCATGGIQCTRCGMRQNRYIVPVYAAPAVEWFSFFSEAISETCATSGIHRSGCGMRQISLQIYITLQKYW